MKVFKMELGGGTMEVQTRKFQNRLLYDGCSSPKSILFPLLGFCYNLVFGIIVYDRIIR